MKRRDFLGSVGYQAAAIGVAGSAMAQGRSRRRPNILFFFPDQHRSDWTSLNPALPDITPNLRELADRGAFFSNAFSPAPVCAPSRACLASGMAYAGCGVASNGNSYPLDKTTFYTLLREAGYHVLGCGKFDLDKPGKSWGLDGKQKRKGKTSLLDAWGFTDGIDNAGKMDGVNAHKAGKPEPYFAYLKSVGHVDAYLKNYKMLDHDYAGPSVLPASSYGDNWIVQNGLNLIRSVPVGEPWFIQLNINGPHPPMDVTKSMYEKWKDTEFPKPVNGNGKYKQASRRNYGAMIDNIDGWLGVCLDEVKARGELDNTLVVYCSDHGEMLGDRGMTGKSQPYHPAACVPLVVAGPRVKGGLLCDKPVETLDVTATLLDYAGLTPPVDMDSISMRPFLEQGKDLPREVAKSSLGGWGLVFDGRYKLIAGNWNRGDGSKKGGAAGAPVLYDLQKDPAEANDIAKDNPVIVKRLSALMPALSPFKKDRAKAKKKA